MKTFAMLFAGTLVACSGQSVLPRAPQSVASSLAAHHHRDFNFNASITVIVPIAVWKNDVPKHQTDFGNEAEVWTFGSNGSTVEHIATYVFKKEPPSCSLNVHGNMKCHEAYSFPGIALPKYLKSLVIRVIDSHGVVRAQGQIKDVPLSNGMRLPTLHMTPAA